MNLVIDALHEEKSREVKWQASLHGRKLRGFSKYRRQFPPGNMPTEDDPELDALAKRLAQESPQQRRARFEGYKKWQPTMQR